MNDLGERFSGVHWRTVWAAYSFGALAVWVTSPWPLVLSAVLGIVVAVVLYHYRSRLEQWLAGQLDAATSDGTPKVVSVTRRRATVAFIVVAAVAGPWMYMWGESGPFDPWNRHALLWPTIVALLLYPMLTGPRDALRTVSVAAVVWSAVIGLFVFADGPFTLRWMRCDDRLTSIVREGRELSVETVGRFCWQDAKVREVDGDTRLYIERRADSGADSDIGQGLVYSPSGAVETADDIDWVRPLGDGWYVFVTRDPLRVRTRWDF